ncbi:hypothetical protein ACFL4C_01430 [Candidatus Omnitrophota bacterium]
MKKSADVNLRRRLVKIEQKMGLGEQKVALIKELFPDKQINDMTDVFEIIQQIQQDFRENHKRAL